MKKFVLVGSIYMLPTTLLSMEQTCKVKSHKETSFYLGFTKISFSIVAEGNNSTSIALPPPQLYYTYLPKGYNENELEKDARRIKREFLPVLIAQAHSFKEKIENLRDKLLNPATKNFRRVPEAIVKRKALDYINAIISQQCTHEKTQLSIFHKKARENNQIPDATFVAKWVKVADLPNLIILEYCEGKLAPINSLKYRN